MHPVSTSLMGQSLAVVQTYLGKALQHQQSVDQQTDFYLHRTPYFNAVLPLAIAGVVSVYRQDSCVALRLIFDRQDSRLATFVYTHDVAQQLFAKITGESTRQWRPIEDYRTADQHWHKVYCLGGNLATAWDASAAGNTLVSDIIVYQERRCGVASPNLDPPVWLEANNLPPGTTSDLSFGDVVGNLYEAEILQATQTYHLIAGYEDGTFRPRTPITREQAIALLLRALEQMLVNPQAISRPDEITVAPFEDVPLTHRSVRQFYAAKQAGILAGGPNNRAYPDVALSRAGLMAIIRNGLQVVVRENYGTTAPLDELVPAIAPMINYTDIEEHWGAQPIRELTTYGIATPLNEQGSEFAPNAAAHRDFAAAALVRMMAVELPQELQLATKSTGSSPTSSKHPLHDPQSPTVTFIDIEGNPYALQIQIAANQYQLVSGFVDGTFRPQNPVTREQAVVILLAALQERLVNEDSLVVPASLQEPPFVDVPVDRWSAPKLQLAKQIGMVAGNALGYFAPEAVMSRAQLMAIAHQALAYGVWQDFGRRTALDQIFNTDMVSTYNFVDVPNNHWAANVMTVMSVLGLAQPQALAQPEIFAPDAAAHRDYTVATAVRMVQLMYTEMPNPLETNGFRDIEDDPYAVAINQAAHQYHLISIPEDSYFQPLVTVQRATIAAMVVQALTPLIQAPGVMNLPDRLTAAPFADVPAAHPAAPDIQFVTAVGIMESDDGTEQFHPQGELTRADLMTVIAKALAFVATTNYGQGVALTSVIDKTQLIPSEFTDISGHAAASAIAQMAQLGIALPQTVGSTEFLPDAPCRRNYAVASMVRLRKLPFQP
ncbi:MAG: S-layer homology domain-containing protein [Leptolyngbya sp. SIOISBB]|nr:S-layer homology domain-containing protein [Leptolyngbya sp. SIOISBB]